MRSSGAHPWGPAGALEETLVHVRDGDSRVAIARTRGTPAAREVEYHVGDRLGSANVVLDATGAQAAREEYFPFGETSLGGLAGQRHRFTGRERDDESLLSYHGARFYAPWLGRWVSREPLAAPRLIQGASPFAYARGNPLRLIDVQGTQEYRPRPHLPRDTDPVARPPDPEFPAWFTGGPEEGLHRPAPGLRRRPRKAGLRSRHRRQDLPYDPYLASERRAMARRGDRPPAPDPGADDPGHPRAPVRPRDFIRLGAGESMAAASVTAEESLAAHLGATSRPRA